VSANGVALLSYSVRVEPTGGRRGRKKPAAQSFERPAQCGALSHPCGPAPTARAVANGTGLNQTPASGSAACEAPFESAPLDPHRVLGRLWRAFLGPGGRRRMLKPGSQTPSRPNARGADGKSDLSQTIILGILRQRAMGFLPMPVRNHDRLTARQPRAPPDDDPRLHGRRGRWCCLSVGDLKRKVGHATWRLASNVNVARSRLRRQNATASMRVKIPTSYLQSTPKRSRGLLQLRQLPEAFAQ